MTIDLNSPVIRISAAATAATLFFGSLTYGICKSRKCKKLEKEILEVKNILKEAEEALNVAKPESN